MSPAEVFARLSDTSTPAPGPVVVRTAVVLGGSIAGLLAARALADHADEVVVLERDDPGTGPRPGAPQGSQTHVLLPAGLRQLERWFPGFTDKAVAAGGRPAPASLRSTYSDGVRKIVGSDTDMLSSSRPFLEAQIRSHTLALPNVRALVARVTGLSFSDTAVTAVQYEGGRLDADFVVDAMGRSSRLADWLKTAGWEPPPMTRMRIDLNYTTAVLRRTGDQPTVRAGVSMHSPGAPSGIAAAAMCQTENDQWMVTLSGYLDHRPGSTPEEFVHLCRTALPGEFGAIAANEMLGGITTYHHADSRRRDFHRLRRFPARLVAAGDAVASFNPIYGQGMSCAVLHASCLSEYLRSGPDLDVAAMGFFALQRVIVDAAWGLSTGGDLELPHVDGPYPRGYRLQKWAIGQIVKASVHDPEIARRFDEVAYLLAHPARLARPGTLVRSILANRR
ncbi:FAD-dependent monooxygenase [Amycolatopsis rhabdoformis]|uniref:FAD-dependent monooxygenase n=1 Tax=Amycolatopsis rhabdoformis TaxID=1448059 RepID=A0ABZ1ILA2_9PSEU|nr:FAD-dependent monooxygenase [Amycolatopsis rhabdoformis]WSE34974.1 FAD-dependent monooxygenase [Amycolatopsis rhabdoformis]